MADDKQLTVAELLARNKASKGADSAAGEEPKRRRRRRSLDEGGISVAELTGNLSKVDSAPHESKHSSVPMDTPAPVIPAPKDGKDAGAGTEKQTTAAETAHQPSDDATAVIQKVTDEPAPAAKKPAEPAAKTGKADKSQPAAAEDSKDPRIAAASADETGEIPVVEDPAKPAATAAATGGATAFSASSAQDGAVDKELARKDASDEVAADADADGEDEKLNPVAVVLLAVIGIVLGAVVFKGFEILWDRFNGVLVSILAVLVTVVMVGVVHALRTARDGFSMGLAAVVGLLLTFGPLLILVL
ncbi:hypothetical protein [Corynebacterium sp. HMSC04H06]|uniref:hypothetical protein n=1 Tax=Corynebacterium sp. HMSC04H06 TaxID=1581050 RepID=UPI0008A36CB0|nr:hypothetical protein [Corynebacterium sp. HMSC04H06]OFS21279.1 hypothetical protein HMPREF3067_06590 [Corynebacterium sp. HMSC04H06]